MSSRGAFVWYELRTTEPKAAGAFYAEVVGWQVEAAGASFAFRAGEGRVAGLSELPERARALGAPAHWLGHLSVEDVDASAQRVIARGGQLLGPVRQDAAGGRVAVLRDPQGAVVALSSRREEGCREGAVWHELHTTDHGQALSMYSELFGWRGTGTLDAGPGVGEYRMFAWGGAERSVGGMASTARAPNVHTHWLFYWAVPDIEGAVEKVRALGGTVVNEPREVRGGERIVYCEDPQGAAFALHQRIDGGNGLA